MSFDLVYFNAIFLNDLKRILAMTHDRAFPSYDIKLILHVNIIVSQPSFLKVKILIEYFKQV